MKKTLKSKFSIAAVVLTMAVCLFSCEGPEGPAGVDGSQGVQGGAGVPGPVGANGPAGTAGTTNIIYSPWITNVWTKQENNFTVDFIEALPITQEIMDKGVVLVYFKESPTSNFIKILPNTYYTNAVPVFTIDFTVELGNLTIFHGVSKNPDGLGVETYSPNSQTRYIIIPGGTAGRMKYPFDINDYEEVCSYFGIKP